jgi:hypothetical protein
MSKDFSLMEDSNRSSNLSIHDVSDPSRRQILRGGLGALALQGVQGQEVHSFKLGATKGPFLQELAGKAYTANIVAAFLLAGLLAT